eukprot:TRINITY_DN40048_c0_g1_i1.p1 TRINITY_DN40048_c0_g1~~TRINITY_DN40048_c0_g1_i1.p1  ORF type:complete len:296 (-),score=80.01 TRINITY_DN40048_c0_g1_i1:366-1253(-)
MSSPVSWARDVYKRQVKGGMGGIAQKYDGPRAGHGQDDGGWGDFQDGQDRRLPRRFLSENGIDASGFTATTMDTAINPDNKGYMLLQKMGWKAGAGLGKQAQGRLDPVRLDEETFRMGLGKSKEYNYYATEATKERLKLDSELTVEEHRVKRQDEAARTQKIEAEIAQVTRKFYCQICDKQYKTYMQYQEHLDSYDHHHKKRFDEMKAMMKGEVTETKEEREQKRAAKEMQKAMQQAATASKPVQEQSKAAEGGMMAPRQGASAVSMSFGKKAAKKPKAMAVKRPVVMQFDADDD